MRSLVLIVSMVLGLCMPLTVLGDSSYDNKGVEPTTKLEAFIAKKGRLNIKDSYDIGIIRCLYGASIQVNSIILYEPGQETMKTKGLRLEIKEVGRHKRSNASFLDFEEGESLSSALNYINGLSSKWKNEKKEYTEVTFSTKGNFRIGFYQKISDQGVFVSSGRINKASCFMSTNNLSSLKDLIDKAVNLLSSK